jgi:hypothetical protein
MTYRCDSQKNPQLAYYGRDCKLQLGYVRGFKLGECALLAAAAMLVCPCQLALLTLAGVPMPAFGRKEGSQLRLVASAGNQPSDSPGNESLLATFFPAGENQCNSAGGAAALAAYAKHVRDSAKKVAVVVPTHDTKWRKWAIKLAQSFVSVKPLDTELFFVFGRLVLDPGKPPALSDGDGGIADFRAGLLQALGAGEDEMPTGVHTVGISEYERVSARPETRRRENYITAKKVRRVRDTRVTHSPPAPPITH